MKLSYNKKQIKKVAKFLFKKNPAFRDSGQEIENIKTTIESDLFRYAKEVKSNLKKDKDWRILSTGGYTIIIMLEYSDSLVAEILVDASIASDPDYTMVKV